MYDKIRIISRISKRWDWLLSALLGLATTRTKCAPLNASPYCSPQGQFQSLKVSQTLLFYLYGRTQTSLHDHINKKSPAIARLSNFGWKMGFEPTTKNHHIPHIINKLQQQPKSTFQKGYKYVHNFCCLNKDIQKYVNNKIPDN